ncbi:MAG: Rpp14/Pop5 family protein [Desulfurococcales archaeon]|nr:Rpp14/Pop5 family protein [Desulfurococcales archaeon]
MGLSSAQLAALACLSLALALAAVAISAYLTIQQLSVMRHLKLISAALSSKVLRRYIKTIEERKSKKIRRRYLVFEVLLHGNEVNLPDAINRVRLEGKIKEAFKELFGSLELSRSGISLVYFDHKEMKGVLRFKAPYRAKVLVALGYIKEINGTDAMIVPLGISGTLKKALAKLRKP